MAYSTEILNALVSALHAAELKFSTDHENGVIHFNIDCGRPRMNLKVAIMARESNFTIYGIYPISADKDDQSSLHSVAEYICRANYGLILGHFNLDMRDGEIQYQTTIDLTGVDCPTEHMINRALAITLKMCEKYAPGFQGILYAGQSAKEACERCEAND